jgi:hypothetical protein
MESDLGLESSMSVLRFGGSYWIKPRHRLDLSLFDLSRSTSRRINETISFGDQTFSVDTNIFSDFDYGITKADYTYAVLSRASGYLGVTGGLYVARFKVSLREATLGTSETEDLTAPLPVLGIRGEYRLTERFSINGAAQWFRLEIDNAGGRLSDYLAGVEYRVGRFMDLGLAYNKVAMRIEATEDGGLDGQLDWGYDGWLMYVQANFGRGK